MAPKHNRVNSVPPISMPTVSSLKWRLYNLYMNIAFPSLISDVSVAKPSQGVQVHLTCCKGLIDCEWTPSKTKGWKESILTYSFLKCIFSNWKVWQNNNLTLITTKLKYTFDLNSLPLSSSPVSLMKFSNVQIYNALE